MTLKELYKTADYKDSHGMLFHGDCLEIMKNIEDEDKNYFNIAKERMESLKTDKIIV